MIIAVTYDNGSVFAHFGHTEQFKLYTVEEGKVLSQEIVDSNGSGHGALAAFLSELSVDLLICGGIGEGAQTALSAAGITVCSGADGSADEAVASYLRGELVSAGTNCDHHHEEQEGGCGSCGSACGGGCGSGCSGCGGGVPILEGRNAGKTCRVHYRGTFNDGTQFDSSYDRGAPMEFTCGIGTMIPGFDKAVVDMEVGQKISIHLMPAEAYGEKDPSMVYVARIAELPGAEELSVGTQVYLQDSYGMPHAATVTEKDDTTITFDMNHEMAGKELNFDIELIEVC